MIDWGFGKRSYDEAPSPQSGRAKSFDADNTSSQAHAAQNGEGAGDAAASNAASTSTAASTAASTDSGSAKSQRKKPAKKSRSLLALAIIFFLISGTCAVYIGFIFYDYYASDQEFSELAQEVSDDSTTADNQNTKIVKLQKKNKHCVAWLSVDDTRIDYPVMYTPHKPQYYLHRNFKRKASVAGTPFIGKNASLEGNSTIVYGHHMADGSMFASLLKFESKDFGASHTFSLLTLTEHRTYQVYAAFYEDLSGETFFHYWDYVGDLGKKRFKKLKKTIKEKTLYRTETKLHYGDRIAMFSTCSYGTSEQRFCVITKLISSK